jgi:hypothetical protein
VTEPRLIPLADGNGAVLYVGELVLTVSVSEVEGYAESYDVLVEADSDRSVVPVTITTEAAGEVARLEV